MKLLQKRRMLEIICSILDLHDSLEYENKINRYDILSECQQRAIIVGNLIEKSGYKETLLISLLEEYCENLYQISLTEYSELELKDILTELSFKIKKIKNKIDDEISDEIYEIVFMPYNATMWDSMDSVYKAAIKDSRFNVTVIPIPYYNISKNKDNIEEKYEGDRFPEYIPITDYKEYNLYEMRPDIIFIHNPYDEFNNVTRVFPQYYSSELIKYTDHLIYIPYYISDTLTMDEMCIMPGVKKAWRVFVQSEKVREQYIKWNDLNKIVALGSPKIDYLLDMASNKITISGEWRKVIAGRKVFLFNTHLNSIINNSKDFIKKLRYVFSIFKDRDNIALIWRPHPLSIETFKSFNQDILTDYINVVNEFKSLHNTIYDDTPDLYHSIGLSDAYIGDSSSSVVKLYGITGKPMLFLNELHLLEKEPKKSIRTICPAIIQDNAYLFSWEYNSLYQINIKTGNIEFKTAFSQEGNMKQNLYSEAISCGNKIYYTPCAANSVVVFNTENNNIKYIALDMDGYNDYNIIKFNSFLIILPIYYSSKIFMLDITTDEIINIPSNYDNTINNFKNFGQIPLFNGRIIVEEKIWRVCRVGNFIQTYDCNTRVFDYYEVDCNIKTFRDIAFDGKDFWILPDSNDNILKWNHKSKEVKEVRILSELDKENENLLYHEICYINGGIWLVPQTADSIIRIDTDSLDIKKINCNNISGFKKDYDDAKLFNDYIIKNNKLYLFPYRSNRIVCIDIISCNIETISTEIKFDCSEIDWINNITHYSTDKEDNDNSHTYEERICSLSQFIQIVVNSLDDFNDQRRKYYSHNINNTDGSCGVKIWEYIIKQLSELEN